MILKGQTAAIRLLAAGALIGAAGFSLAGCQHGGVEAPKGVNPPAVLPTAEPPRHAPLDPTLIVGEAAAEFVA